MGRDEESVDADNLTIVETLSDRASMRTRERSDSNPTVRQVPKVRRRQQKRLCVRTNQWVYAGWRWGSVGFFLLCSLFFMEIKPEWQMQRNEIAFTVSVDR